MFVPLIPVADARLDFGRKLRLRRQIQSFKLKAINSRIKEMPDITLLSGNSLAPSESPTSTPNNIQPDVIPSRVKFIRVEGCDHSCIKRMH